MHLGNFLMMTCVVGFSWASPFYGSSTVATPSKTLFSQCTSSSDCSKNECCYLSPNRYSLPTCAPMRQEGDLCRPGQPMILDSVLSYPNNKTIKLNDVHYIVCPCQDGLTCKRDINSGAVCSRDVINTYNNNDLIKK